jgi:hypothetical protein
VTKLTGEAEVPPGDADGIGRAKILLHQQRSQVCWFIRVRKITLPATAAHIHFAPAGVAGDIVVPLSAPDARGQARGCISADPVLIAAIAENPEQYYVNVHNADYPAGALRGQLG